MTKPWQGATADLLDTHPDLPVCETALRSFGRRTRFGGLIQTIRCHQDIGLLKNMLGTPGNGCVIVVDGDGSPGTALLGGSMAALAARNGWAGLVINGAVRDTVELMEVDIGIRALGTTPRRPGFDGTGDEGIPVSFGGVTFTPGHWLYCDEDGIVLSPRVMDIPAG